MTVVTSISRAAARSTREASEFDGLYINAGICVAGEGKDAEDKFVRLPRGIAVADLKPKKVYDSMDANWAAETAIVNQVIAQIQAKAAGLAEGESLPINLELRLYRRQEEATVAPNPAVDVDLAKSLFG